MSGLNERKTQPRSAYRSPIFPFSHTYNRNIVHMPKNNVTPFAAITLLGKRNAAGASSIEYIGACTTYRDGSGLDESVKPSNRAMEFAHTR